MSKNCITIDSCEDSSSILLASATPAPAVNITPLDNDFLIYSDGNSYLVSDIGDEVYDLFDMYVLEEAVFYLHAITYRLDLAKAAKQLQSLPSNCRPSLCVNESFEDYFRRTTFLTLIYPGQGLASAKSVPQVKMMEAWATFFFDGNPIYLLAYIHSHRSYFFAWFDGCARLILPRLRPDWDKIDRNYRLRLLGHHDDLTTSYIHLKIVFWDELLASLVLLFQSRGHPAMPRLPLPILDYEPNGILADEFVFYDMCETVISQTAAAATSSPAVAPSPVTTFGAADVGLLSLWDDVMHELACWHQFPRLPYTFEAIRTHIRGGSPPHLSGWSSLFPQPKPSCDMEPPCTHPGPPRPTFGLTMSPKANNSTRSCRSRVMPPTFVAHRVSTPCSAFSSWTTIQRASRAIGSPLTSCHTASSLLLVSQVSGLRLRCRSETAHKTARLKATVSGGPDPLPPSS